MSSTAEATSGVDTSKNFMFQSGIDKCYGTGGTQPNLVIAGILPIYDYRTDSDIFSPNGTPIDFEKTISTAVEADYSELLTTSGDVLPYQIGGMFITPKALSGNNKYVLVATESDYSKQYAYTAVPVSGTDTYNMPDDAAYEGTLTKVTLIKDSDDKLYCNGYYMCGGDEVTNNYPPSETVTFGGAQAYTCTQPITQADSISWNDLVIKNCVTYIGSAKPDESGKTIGCYSITIPRTIGTFKFNKLMTFVKEVNGSSETYYPLSIMCFKNALEYDNPLNVQTINAYISFAKTTGDELEVTAELADLYWRCFPTQESAAEGLGVQMLASNQKVVINRNDSITTDSNYNSILEDAGVLNVLVDPDPNEKQIVIGTDVEEGNHAEVRYEADGTMNIHSPNSVILKSGSGEGSYGSGIFSLERGNNIKIGSPNTLGPAASYSFVHGVRSSAVGNKSYVIGDYSTAGYLDSHGRISNHSLVFGNNSSAIGNYSVSFGAQNYIQSDYSLVWGFRSSAYTDGFVLGSQSKITNFAVAVIGGGSSASGDGSIVLGEYSDAKSAYSIVLGNNSMADGFNSMVFGRKSSATGSAPCVMGYSSSVTGTGSVVLGSNSSAYGSYSSVIGYNNRVYQGSMGSNGDDTYVFGRGNHISDGVPGGGAVVTSGSVVIGNYNGLTGSDNIIIGDYIAPRNEINRYKTNNSIIIGKSSSEYVSGLSEDNSFIAFIRKGDGEGGYGAGLGFIRKDGATVSSSAQLTNFGTPSWLESSYNFTPPGDRHVKFYLENIPYYFPGAAGTPAAEGYMNGYLSAVYKDGTFYLVVCPADLPNGAPYGCISENKMVISNEYRP